MVVSVVRVEIKHECDIPKLATTTSLLNNKIHVSLPKITDEELGVV